MPAASDLAQNYWYIRGRSLFLTGHPVEGTAAFVERERYLTDTGALRASREQLFNAIRDAAERGESLQVAAENRFHHRRLAAIGRRTARAAARSHARQRRSRELAAPLSATPRERERAALAQSQIAVATEFPDQIALLLPLSGRAEAIGVAVRDGFIAGFLEQDAASRPRLKIYDVAAESLAGAYQHAVQDGAGFVVGPLTKEDVAAIVPLSAGRMPVLALNFLADSVNASGNFYQFALLPEDEARIVARRLVADGKLRGVAICRTANGATASGRHSPMS